MRNFLSLALLLFWVQASLALQEKPVARYAFPGPRSEDKDTSGSYPVRVKRKPQYEDLIDAYSNKPTSRSSSGTNYRPSVADPYSGRSYGPQDPSTRAYSAPSSGSPGRYESNSYAPSRNSKEENYKEDLEEEKKPGRLELLLAQSKFTCQGKKDGYYADNSVACQVFHYCISGAKHSWQCPEGTVFHQVHLNCVPASQDICSQSEKFYVVNDYLHKPIDNHGPNNSIRYHQRYYPEEFLGDPLTAGHPSVQSYPPRSESPRGPAGYNSAEEDDPSVYDRPYSAPASRTPSRPSSYGGSYSQANPKHVTPAPYTTRARPYSGSNYASLPNVGSRSPSSYSSSGDDGSYSQYNKPTPSPYTSSTRSQSGSNYRPDTPSYSPPPSYSSSGYAPPSPSGSYAYKPVSAQNPSSSYDYSRPSSYSPSISPKSSSVPYSYPPYSPYSGSASSDANSASFPARSSYSGPSKPYSFSGVHYEEDYS